MNPNTGTDNSFLSLHSPRGSAATFSLGLENHGGGFGLQEEYIDLGRDVFIGYQDGDGTVHLLPYYRQPTSNAAEAFVQDGAAPQTLQARRLENVKRQLGYATDRFEAGDVQFEILTPVTGIPDPGTATPDEVKDTITPAILVRLTVDNRSGTQPRRAFFATQGFQGAYPLCNAATGQLTGLACRHDFGFAVDACTNPDVRVFADFDLLNALGRKQPLEFCLPSLAGLIFEVGPGQTRTLDIALGWFKPYPVTRPRPMKYYYTRFFDSINDVLGHALAQREKWWEEGRRQDRLLADSGLNHDRQFIIAQAVRAYWGSTMLFDDNGRPRWVVNEGSFLMMNTFDLTADQLFFEIRHMPWAVRHELDCFAAEYSYTDTVHFPARSDSFPGGVAFTHDQGVFNTWSKPGQSSYEIPDQDGCFSYMTHEELVNWICCAGVYFTQTRDLNWLRRNEALMTDILQSMQNRDHPDPARRDGVMDLDSDRCGTASEITTYDSLDPSLGQARRNTYLVVKCWAAYLALAEALRHLGQPDLERDAQHSARLCADTVAAAYDESLGYIPAILDGHNQSAIIPAVEGLVFPLEMGLHQALSESGPYADMIKRLKQHLQTILVPGKCLFADGGWKLSEQSANSWASKIFLCQHVARHALGLDFGAAESMADRAHADWWRRGAASNPGIDQIHAGKVTNVGFYYPRAVTSALWLEQRVRGEG